LKAVVVHETGGPEVLRLEETEPPAVGDGEVLIRVHAASVNPIDWKRRAGISQISLPAVLGNDASGVVEESRADGIAEGDEVFGMVRTGGYAELAAAAGGAVAKKPAGITHEQAAALPVAGLTAWQGLLEEGGLQGGQTALVAGAAGGVGHLAVQFAKKVAGARVIGTGSSGNRDFVTALGADEYVDYTQQDVAEVVSDVDVAFDTVGGDVTASLVPTLREGGIIVVIANAPPEEAARERGARAVLHVTRPNSELLERVAGLVADGTVHVELSEVLPLSEVRRAHELSEAGHVRGKIVLTIV
jgi:NADPH:quinone reductase-like Zn-dependent oxidoreductase